jgi:hypothetical protein
MKEKLAACISHEQVFLLKDRLIFDVVGIAVGPWLWKEAKNEEEKVKSELRGRHSDCHWVEVSKKNRKDGAKCGKASRWMRRSRMTDQQGRWTEDDSGSGKIQH